MTNFSSEEFSRKKMENFFFKKIKILQKIVFKKKTQNSKLDDFDRLLSV